MKTVITKIEKQTRMMVLALVCIFTLLTAVNNVYAQVPKTIPYQAVARDNSGNIIANQNISLRFSIHDVTSSGTIVYRETHMVTTSALGLFSVTIGTGTPITGILATVNWGTGAKFIQVEMDPAGGAIYIDMGTTQLMSVPYALFAEKSSDLPSGTVTGNTMHWNGTAWVEDNALYNDGTNVGIGTSSPGAKLHVAGNIKIADGNQGAGKVLTSDANGLASWALPSATGTNTGDVTLTTVGASPNSSGASISGQSLTLQPADASNGGVVTTGAQTFAGDKTFSSDVSVNGVRVGTGNMNIPSNTAVGSGAMNSNTTGNYNTATGNYSMLSNTTGGHNTASGYSSLFANTTGTYNTAYGTSALSYNTTGWANTALGRYALISSVGGSSNSAVGMSSLFSNSSGYNNTAVGVVALSSNTTGNDNTAIGYGADVGSGNLSNATAIGSGAIVSQSNSLVLGNNVNVGIGTSAPGAKLHVAGNIKIVDGSQGAGKVLTSDANGLASWATPSSGSVAAVTASSPLSATAGTTPDISLTGTIPVANGGSGTNSILSGYMKGGNPMTAVSSIPGSDITGDIPGNASGFTGSLAGDISGTQSSILVDKIKGVDVSAAAPANTQVLTYNSSLNQWEPQTPATGSGSGWGLTGNNGTNSSTDFIGTTDAQPLVFKVNNFKSGLIDYDASSANTSLGYQALNANIAGSSNTATGYLALNSNTYGGYNIANGANALFNNNFGFYNVAVGCSTLYNNSGGSNNIAIGYNALYSNTTAQNNVAIGPHSLYNTSGSSAGLNTAIGYGALYSNVAGYNATAVGARAMYYANSSASGTYNFNVAVGYEALRGSNTPANNTGNWNTAIGYSTLLNNSTGNYNIAAGPNALSFNTTGNQNIGIGYNALIFNTTGGKNVATGYQSLLSNSSGNENTANGFQALINSTGSNNTAMGYSSGSNISSGSNNITVGSNAQVPTAAADNQVRIGDASISYAGVQVAWTITSDRRWKSDIKESELGLNFISKLRPVSYYRNNDESRKREYGFIAQELEETLNASGAGNNGIISKDDGGMYGVRYNDLIAPMVKAIQELSKENKDLKEANASFKTDIENIKAQLQMQVKAGSK